MKIILNVFRKKFVKKKKNRDRFKINFVKIRRKWTYIRHIT